MYHGRVELSWVAAHVGVTIYMAGNAMVVAMMGETSVATAMWPFPLDCTTTKTTLRRLSFIIRMLLLLGCPGSAPAEEGCCNCNMFCATQLSWLLLFDVCSRLFFKMRMAGVLGS